VLDGSGVLVGVDLVVGSNVGVIVSVSDGYSVNLVAGISCCFPGVHDTRIVNIMKAIVTTYDFLFINFSFFYYFC